MYKLYIYISRCHGNVRLNDDSKSHRIIPIAWRVTINPIYVRCGQCVRDDINDIIHTQLLYIIGRSVIIIVIIIIIESEVTEKSSISCGSWRLRHVAFL